jgi:hypothetical protein
MKAYVAGALLWQTAHAQLPLLDALGLGGLALGAGASVSASGAAPTPGVAEDSNAVANLLALLSAGNGIPPGTNDVVLPQATLPVLDNSLLVLPQVTPLSLPSVSLLDALISPTVVSPTQLGLSILPITQLRTGIINLLTPSATSAIRGLAVLPGPIVAPPQPSSLLASLNGVFGALDFEDGSLENSSPLATPSSDVTSVLEPVSGTTNDGTGDAGSDPLSPVNDTTVDDGATPVNNTATDTPVDTGATPVNNTASDTPVDTGAAPVDNTGTDAPVDNGAAPVDNTGTDTPVDGGEAPVDVVTTTAPFNSTVSDVVDPLSSPGTTGGSDVDNPIDTIYDIVSTATSDFPAVSDVVDNPGNATVSDVVSTITSDVPAVTSVVDDLSTTTVGDVASTVTSDLLAVSSIVDSPNTTTVGDNASTVTSDLLAVSSVVDNLSTTTMGSDVANTITSDLPAVGSGATGSLLPIVSSIFGADGSIPPFVNSTLAPTFKPNTGGPTATPFSTTQVVVSPLGSGTAGLTPDNTTDTSLSDVPTDADGGLSAQEFTPFPDDEGVTPTQTVTPSPTASDDADVNPSQQTATDAAPYNPITGANDGPYIPQQPPIGPSGYDGTDNSPYDAEDYGGSGLGGGEGIPFGGGQGIPFGGSQGIPFGGGQGTPFGGGQGTPFGGGQSTPFGGGQGIPFGGGQSNFHGNGHSGSHGNPHGGSGSRGGFHGGRSPHGRLPGLRTDSPYGTQDTSDYDGEDYGYGPGGHSKSHGKKPTKGHHPHTSSYEAESENTGYDTEEECPDWCLDEHSSHFTQSTSQDHSRGKPFREWLSRTISAEHPKKTGGKTMHKKKKTKKTKKTSKKPHRIAITVDDDVVYTSNYKREVTDDAPSSGGFSGFKWPSKKTDASSLTSDNSEGSAAKSQDKPSGSSQTDKQISDQLLKGSNGQRGPPSGKVSDNGADSGDGVSGSTLPDWLSDLQKPKESGAVKPSVTKGFKTKHMDGGGSSSGGSENGKYKEISKMKKKSKGKCPKSCKYRASKPSSAGGWGGNSSETSASSSKTSASTSKTSASSSWTSASSSWTSAYSSETSASSIEPSETGFRGKLFEGAPEFTNSDFTAPTTFLTLASPNSAGSIPTTVPGGDLFGSGDTFTGDTLAGVCPKQCNPFNPTENICDGSTSCATAGGSKYYCACRAGFMLSETSAKDFSKQFKVPGQAYVYVYPGAKCDKPCAGSLCDEVIVRGQCV